jgi:signal transduction histidine kinase
LPQVPAGRTALQTPDGIERLFRRRQGAFLGGVAGGVADHLRVPVIWVRAAFAVLSALAGAGIVAYALLWIFVPQNPVAAPPPATSARERRQAIGIAAIGLALVFVGAALGFSSAVGWILGPLGLAAIGAAFIWREADDTRRARWRRSASGMATPGAAAWWRLGGGIALVVGGLTVFALGQFEFSAIRSALVAVLLTLIGIGLITIPWWLRLVRALGEERRERIAETERAEIAAHLHDSVLQTLALIQRQSGDAREVLRLARGQERELRTWLYGPAGYAGARGTPGQTDGDTMLAAALATAAGEVEDTYAVKVEPVVVGDAEMHPGLAALVAAAKEAMVNAAKHSGQTELSCYAEVEGGTASVFVRDRGVGFDPGAVDADRRGLAESIRGRMDRHGGTATVRSAPGQGTEVELTMPIEQQQPPVELKKRPEKESARGADSPGATR